MAVTASDSSGGFNGTSVYSGFQKRNASTLAIEIDGGTNEYSSFGFQPFDGTYMYVSDAGVIYKINASTTDIVSYYTPPSGYTAPSVTFDGKYLYVSLYSATNYSISKVDPATMTQVGIVSVADTGLAVPVLANSLKYAVSWAFP